MISMACLPVMLWYKRKGRGTLGSKVSILLIIVMGLLPCIATMLKIGGKSPTEDLVYFVLGYFFLSNDILLEKLDKYRFLLLGLFFMDALRTTFLCDGEFYETASWLAILTILGMGRRYLNFCGKITDYLAGSSFCVYIFHQSWIVIAAFLIFKLTDNPILQIPLIFLMAVSLSYLSYEACKRVSVFRWMFGIKNK